MCSRIAEAIWEDAQRPGMRYVATKTEDQQALLGVHCRRLGCDVEAGRTNTGQH
jgi:hypothetical protein